VKYRSGPVFHRFQQDTNFFYLTGFEEPESVAIIGSAHDHLIPTSKNLT
jgi:intermediate cleaving peptidase 55